jgi:hypothetical protein
MPHALLAVFLALLPLVSHAPAHAAMAGSLAPALALPSRPDIVFVDADILPKAASRELTILYYLSIARGHLLASIELAKHGKLEQAVLHSRHALDESWIELAHLLPVDKAQLLRDKIEAMNEAVALKIAISQIIAAHQATSAYIEDLIEETYAPGLPRTVQKLEIIILLLQQAQAEYEETWQGAELHEPAEYEDGFAFVQLAKAELESLYPELRSRDPIAAEQIERTVARLAGDWPSPEPPGKPAMSQPLLRALVTAVEINARRFFN